MIVHDQVLRASNAHSVVALCWSTLKQSQIVNNMNTLFLDLHSSNAYGVDGLEQYSYTNSNQPLRLLWFPYNNVLSLSLFPRYLRLLDSRQPHKNTQCAIAGRGVRSVQPTQCDKYPWPGLLLCGRRCVRPVLPSWHTLRPGRICMIKIPMREIATSDG